MLRLGINVPPAFCITTDECRRFHDAGGAGRRTTSCERCPARWPAWRRPPAARSAPGRCSSPCAPGAPQSMPGMMDTVLNLGVDRRRRQPIRAGDDIRRTRFREKYAQGRRRRPARRTRGSSCTARSPRCSRRGSPSARSPTAQPRPDRGRRDRRHRPGDGLRQRSTPSAPAPACCSRRNPLTGVPEPFGEWLAGGQGEDVVSGSHDPEPLAALASRVPRAAPAADRAAATLERDGRDMLDIEFTVESGRLWLLQARAGKRSPAARASGSPSCSSARASSRRPRRWTASRPTRPRPLLRAHVDPDARADATLLATGKPACPGLVNGVDRHRRRRGRGPRRATARPSSSPGPSTTPDDMHAMAVVAGIVTEVGGATSHAAVVSRELGVAVRRRRRPRRSLELDGPDRHPRRRPRASCSPATYPRPRHRGRRPDLAQLAEWARAETGADGPLPELLAARRRELAGTHP